MPRRSEYCSFACVWLPQALKDCWEHSFGMWSLMKSPLLLGTDMTFTANPHLEKTILGIVSNTHVLGIDQDVRLPP